MLTYMITIYKRENLSKLQTWQLTAPALCHGCLEWESPADGTENRSHFHWTAAMSRRRRESVFTARSTLALQNTILNLAPERKTSAGTDCRRMIIRILPTVLLAVGSVFFNQNSGNHLIRLWG